MKFKRVYIKAKEQERGKKGPNRDLNSRPRRYSQFSIGPELRMQPLHHWAFPVTIEIVKLIYIGRDGQSARKSLALTERFGFQSTENLETKRKLNDTQQHYNVILIR